MHFGRKIPDVEALGIVGAAIRAAATKKPATSTTIFVPT
jgi:hypothetical protein